MQHNEDWIKRWEDIVNSVDKDHVPIECVKKVIFRIQSGKQKTINLKKLKDQGLNIDEIGSVVDRFVNEFSDEITNMEFVLDVQAVANLLQPETDKILKGIK